MAEELTSSKLLKRGCMYTAKYKRYRVDPNPVLFVLWADKVKVHAININYLDSSKIDETLKFLSAHINIIVTRYNAKTFYHRFIKHKMPQTVATAYRTYFAYELRNVKEIAINPLQSLTVLKGVWKSRDEKEEKGAKPTSYENPTSTKITVGPAKSPEVIKDYVDMLASIYPKKDTGGIFSRLFKRR